MGDVVKLADGPDPREFDRREKRAMREQEMMQRAHERVEWREDELAYAEQIVAQHERAGSPGATLWTVKDRVRAARVRLVAARETYRQADGRAKAAWDDVLALFGGSYERMSRWEDRRWGCEVA